MEVILTQKCKSLTGVLGSGFGYHIQRRKNGFFSKRNAKGVVPPDGHWRFIVSCALLAKLYLHIADIKVSREEVRTALLEAGYIKPHYELVKFADDYPETFSAKGVLNLKQEFGL